MCAFKVMTRSLLRLLTSQFAFAIILLHAVFTRLRWVMLRNNISFGSVSSSTYAVHRSWRADLYKACHSTRVRWDKISICRDWLDKNRPRIRQQALVEDPISLDHVQEKKQTCFHLFVETNICHPQILLCPQPLAARH